VAAGGPASGREGEGEVKAGSDCDVEADDEEATKDGRREVEKANDVWSPLGGNENISSSPLLPLGPCANEGGSWSWRR
jgi:hypothetical protein